MPIAFAQGIIAVLTPCVLTMVPVIVAALTKTGLSKTNKWSFVLTVSGLTICFYLVISSILVNNLDKIISDIEIEINSLSHWLAIVLFITKIILGLYLTGTIKIISEKNTSDLLVRLSILVLIPIVFFISSFSCTSVFIATFIVLESGSFNLFAILIHVFFFSLGMVMPVGLIIIILLRWIVRMSERKGWVIFQIIVGIYLLISGIIDLLMKIL